MAHRSRLAAGASWSADIEQAIDRSQIVLALLSCGSFASDICRGEQLRALRRGKRVIVLLLSADADRPVFLETKIYVSFVASRRSAEALAELIAEISGQHGDTRAQVSGHVRNCSAVAGEHCLETRGASVVARKCSAR